MNWLVRAFVVTMGVFVVSVVGGFAAISLFPNTILAQVGGALFLYGGTQYPIIAPLVFVLLVLRHSRRPPDRRRPGAARPRR